MSSCPSKEIVSVPDVPTKELTALELSAVVSDSIAIGISKGILSIITSPEVSVFMESIAKGKALSGMMEALVQHDGRKGLDASLMKQNSIEIAHFIEQAFTQFQKRAMDVTNGTDPEIKSAEELQGFQKD